MDTIRAAEQIRTTLGITVEPDAIAEQAAAAETNARIAAALAAEIDFESEPADFVRALEQLAPTR